MVVRENRALPEWIRDRCKRTGIGWISQIANKFQFSVNVLVKYPFAVLLVRAPIHEFARVSRTIIHGAVKSKKLPYYSTSSPDRQRLKFGCITRNVHVPQ